MESQDLDSESARQKKATPVSFPSNTVTKRTTAVQWKGVL